LRNQFPTVEEFGDGIESGFSHVHDDNGLIIQSRRFRAACRAARLRREFITSYTPEQNGIVERFFRSLKEKCVWQPAQLRRFRRGPCCHYSVDSMVYGILTIGGCDYAGDPAHR
jgi:hypothetical protein